MIFSLFFRFLFVSVLVWKFLRLMKHAYHFPFERILNHGVSNDKVLYGGKQE